MWMAGISVEAIHRRERARTSLTRAERTGGMFNSPFSLRRTPRLVTESVMERAKVKESSRWWW